MRDLFDVEGEAFGDRPYVRVGFSDGALFADCRLSLRAAERLAKTLLHQVKYVRELGTAKTLAERRAVIEKYEK
jgi:hypothetical protein